ncbi:MAG: AAA family ATPase [Acidilobaceae archaeon]
MSSGADISVCDKTGPVVVVAGPPGSGKSTYARRLSADLNLRYFTTGEIFRALATERGLSLVELNEIAERDPGIDYEIEKRTLREACRGGVVIDSHLAAWLLREVADVTVYVKADLATRASRIAVRDGRRVEESLDEILSREESHWRRFLRYYGIDITDVSHFDLVVDTTGLSIEEAYRIIYELVVAKLAKKREASSQDNPYKSSALD